MVLTQHEHHPPPPHPSLSDPSRGTQFDLPPHIDQSDRLEAKARRSGFSLGLQGRICSLLQTSRVDSFYWLFFSSWWENV